MKSRVRQLVVAFLVLASVSCAKKGEDFFLDPYNFDQGDWLLVNEYVDEKGTPTVSIVHDRALLERHKTLVHITDEFCSSTTCPNSIIIYRNGRLLRSFSYERNIVWGGLDAKFLPAREVVIESSKRGSPKMRFPIGRSYEVQHDVQYEGRFTIAMAGFSLGQEESMANGIVESAGRDGPVSVEIEEGIMDFANGEAEIVFLVSSSRRFYEEFRIDTIAELKGVKGQIGPFVAIPPSVMFYVW